MGAFFSACLQWYSLPPPKGWASEQCWKCTVSSVIFSWLNPIVKRSTLWLCQQLAIENGHRNSEFSRWKNGGSFHSYVKLPEGISDTILPYFTSWKSTTQINQITKEPGNCFTVLYLFLVCLNLHNDSCECWTKQILYHHIISHPPEIRCFLSGGSEGIIGCGESWAGLITKVKRCRKSFEYDLCMCLLCIGYRLYIYIGISFKCMSWSMIDAHEPHMW